MVDVIACTVFGSRSGSLDNWSKGVRDPLSIAVYDFPKRGIMVRTFSVSLGAASHAFSAAERRADLGVEARVQDSEREVQGNVQL